ncbi:MAG TPA: DUF1501 domain-containing protein [Gammaproteobacteria bacterium]
MLDRRRFLSGAAQLGLLTTLPGLARSQRAADSRFVLVILRGGLDGLAAVPPLGDPSYANVRGSLAIASADALRLNDLFGLHPALRNAHGLYGQGELAVLHAAATPYRERSHFDGQAVLENGAGGPGETRDGWLNRAAGMNPAVSSAVALSQNIPLVLRGDVSVSSWAPSRLPEADDDTLDRLDDLYANDPHLSARLEEGISARDLAGRMGGATRQRAQLGPLVAAAGRFLSAPDGPRIAVLETGGWDTHANQGAAQGVLAARLSGLDEGLVTLKSELGDVWRETVVVVATEFGRTVAVNGTRGTDHGTAGCAFVAGGAVNGGRVVSDWPGLARRDLYEGRDLKPTLDLRAVFKGVLEEHFDVTRTELDREIFPSSGDVAPLAGLIRA